MQFLFPFLSPEEIDVLLQLFTLALLMGIWRLAY